MLWISPNPKRSPAPVKATILWQYQSKYLYGSAVCCFNTGKKKMRLPSSKIILAVDTSSCLYWNGVNYFLHSVFMFNCKDYRNHFTFVLLTAVIPLLLILSADVHQGPSLNHKCCQLNKCHYNIRRCAKLLAIQTTLKNAFDIITLSETHLMHNV